MTSPAAHRKALFLMVTAASLWSIAGVLTRQLHAAHGFEVTFWRSLFAALFVAGAMLWQHRSRALGKLFDAGWFGLISGVMWAVMFCCFMIALTMTTVANTLIVMSVTPLLTAVLAWLVLRQKIVLRTWLAIAVALAGMVWMFAGGMSSVDATGLAGMLVATGIPIAMAVNVIVLKKAGKSLDLVPAVLTGALISGALMLPLAMPLQASPHDVGILAVLGVLQLGFPCMLMVGASRHLSAPEISLLGLLEVLLGPIWAWLGAGEVPAIETLAGGGVVLAALVFNELLALKEDV
ncbi:DMT family transporter [Undibacterium sp.]|uniref:DMT family transporter n=1 Tax=Undibacterium sp. TaxID=1914977 RepID=UPI00374D43F7